MQIRNQITQQISVQYEYDVRFTKSVFDISNSTLNDIVAKSTPNVPHKIFFIIEEKLLQHYPAIIAEITRYCMAYKATFSMSAPPCPLAGGERFKTFSKIESLCQLFSENSLCRHSFIAMIGGGAFLDSVGFAASLVHRGIRQIRIPTTVVSQSDSGVGVKTGINMFDKKNFAGTFAPPYAVINDSEFLKSLTYRDWISGVPEALKVAMIKDTEFFQWLIENAAKFAERNISAMTNLVAKSAELHLEHIATSGDPFEFGSARPLDFGHWSAHKLEILSKGNIRHGEAVGIGILLDSFYAVKTGRLAKEVLTQLLEAYRIMRLPTYDPLLSTKKPDGSLEIIDGIEEFREHLGGELHITLPSPLGEKIEISEINTQILSEGIEFLMDNG